MAVTEQARKKRGRLRVTTREAALIFVIIGLIAFFGGYVWTDAPSEMTFGEYVKDIARQGYSNFGIEALSIAATVLVIESLGKRQADREREEREREAAAERKAIEEQNRKQAEAERKAELILQMGSPDKGFAVEAVRLLRHKGWLTDGSLQEAYLLGANLEGADLRSANLEGAVLRSANLGGANLGFANLEGADLGFAKLEGAVLRSAKLEGADLFSANLEGANLFSANLEGAGLVSAKLEGANLVSANLEGADLEFANLEGADLRSANLEGAHLDDTVFGEKTKLPDTTSWTPETDMRRFTDPEHPEFWRSDYPRSPAYRGDQGGGES